MCTVNDIVSERFEREALAARVRDLEGRQAGPRAALRAELDAEEAAIEARIAEEAAAAAAFVAGDELGVALRCFALRATCEGGGKSKQKKKKKNAKPSPEVIKFKQSKRQREKQLREAQRVERVAFVEALSDPEYEALEAIVEENGSEATPKDVHGPVDAWIDGR